MGDRFYEQQAGSNRAQAKPKRKLKVEWVTDIETILETTSFLGLLKTDLKTLEKLYEAIHAKII